MIKSLKTYLVLILMLCWLPGITSAGGKKKDKNQALTEAQIIELKNYFFEGQKNKMLGNNEKAYEFFKKIIAIDPKNDAAYYELAAIKIQYRQLSAAIPLMESARNLNPENKWYQQTLAALYENAKEYDKGADVYEELISQYPNEMGYYESLANMYLYKNDLKGALKVYNRIESKFGVNDVSSGQKQKIYLSQNKIDEAIEEAQKLVDAAPGTPRYYTNLAELYSKNGEQEKAIETYKNLLEIDPDNAYVQLSMSVYYYEGGDVPKAKETMRTAFANPGLDFTTKARILFNDIAYQDVPEGQINPFGLELADILQNTHSDNPKAFAISGDLNFQANNKTKALESYSKSLELDENQFLVWSQILLLYSDENQWDSVFTQSKKVMELFPSQPSGYYFRGIAGNQIKEYKSAAEALETGKDFVLDNNNLLSQFYTNLADAYHNLEEHTKSDKYFDKALVINPEDDLVLNNYSYYLSLRGEKLDKAAQMAAMVVERNPKSATYLDTYAWVLYKKGDFEEAKKYMEQALANGGEEEGVLHEHLGDILYKLNDLEGALKSWNRAKVLGGGSELLDKKIETRQLHE